MTIHNLYIFDRHCNCLFYYEWDRKQAAGMSAEEEQKLVYGVLFSLKNLCDKLSPVGSTGDAFYSFRTNAYKLHYFETNSGLKFVMNTDISVGNARDYLRHIYSECYVALIARNPLCRLEDKIDNELFIKSVDRYVRGLPVF